MKSLRKFWVVEYAPESGLVARKLEEVLWCNFRSMMALEAKRPPAIVAITPSLVEAREYIRGVKAQLKEKTNAVQENEEREVQGA